MLPEDLITEETVALYVKNASKRGHTYTHEDWPKNLWSLGYIEIITYLGQRIAKTKDSAEYYGILPYLVGHVPSKILLKPFSKRSKKIAVDPATFKTNMRRPRKFIAEI